jgi:hypothetical protein
MTQTQAGTQTESHMKAQQAKQEIAATETGAFWSVAVHEAGHCLGARLAGVKITSATIEPSRHFEGQVRSARSYWESDVISDLLGHQAELEFGLTWHSRTSRASEGRR